MLRKPNILDVNSFTLHLLAFHCIVVLEQDHYPSLVLVQPRKTRPCLTERLLMGRKESNKQTEPLFLHFFT